MTKKHEDKDEEKKTGADASAVPPSSDKNEKEGGDTANTAKTDDSKSAEPKVEDEQAPGGYHQMPKSAWPK